MSKKTNPELEQKIYQIMILNTKGMKIQNYQILMNQFENNAKLVVEHLQDKSVSANKSYDVPTYSKIHNMIIKTTKLGGQILTFQDSKYPKALLQYKSFPHVIYTLGNLDLLDRTCISIVGSRNASITNMKFTKILAEELGVLGYTIVSGLAPGIDTMAHEGSLETGTVAVSGVGLDCIYPKSNKTLYNQIAQKGLIITEFPLGTSPIAKNFPQRNQTITALSKALVITEATPRSGSLNSMFHAIKQNKIIMSIPSSPLEKTQNICNQLIRNGAIPITNSRDVIETIQNYNQKNYKIDTTNITSITSPISKSHNNQNKSNSNNLKLEDKILSKISYHPISSDELVELFNIPMEQINIIISKLELKGLVQRDANRKIITCDRKKYKINQ